MPIHFDHTGDGVLNIKAPSSGSYDFDGTATAGGSPSPVSKTHAELLAMADGPYRKKVIAFYNTGTNYDTLILDDGVGLTIGDTVEIRNSADAVNGDFVISNIQDATGWGYTGKTGVTFTGAAWDNYGAMGYATRQQVTGTLTPYQKYRITDYQCMVDASYDTGTILTGPTEEIIVTAATSTELFSEAYSEDFPQDLLYYELVPEFDYAAGEYRKGKITRRIDTVKKIEMGEDWRGAKHRRWTNGCSVWTGPFYGTGNNDLTVGSTALDVPNNIGIYVQIDGAAPDTFSWAYLKSGIDPTTDYEATGVTITAGNMNLPHGIVISFGATTGHIIGDSWQFQINPKYELFNQGALGASAYLDLYSIENSRDPKFANNIKIASNWYNSPNNMVFAANMGLFQADMSGFTSVSSIETGLYCDKFTFGVGTDCTWVKGTFGELILGDGCSHVEIGMCCDGIILGNSCAQIVIGHNTGGHIIGDSCGEITIENDYGPPVTLPANLHNRTFRNDHLKTKTVTAWDGCGLGQTLTLGTGGALPGSAVDGDTFGLETDGLTYERVGGVWVPYTLDGHFKVSYKLYTNPITVIDGTCSHYFVQEYGGPDTPGVVDGKEQFALFLRSDEEHINPVPTITINSVENGGGNCILIQKWAGGSMGRSTSHMLDCTSVTSWTGAGNWGTDYLNVNIFELVSPILCSRQNSRPTNDYNGSEPGDWNFIGGQGLATIEKAGIHSDGWGNDPGVSSNGTIQRFTLSQEEYAHIPKPYRLDPLTTGYGSPTIPAATMDFATFEPWSHVNKPVDGWVQLTDDAVHNYWCDGYAWHTMLKSQYGLLPYVVGTNNETRILCEKGLVSQQNAVKAFIIFPFFAQDLFDFGLPSIPFIEKDDWLKTIPRDTPFTIDASIAEECWVMMSQSYSGKWRDISPLTHLIGNNHSFLLRNKANLEVEYYPEGTGVGTWTNAHWSPTGGMGLLNRKAYPQDGFGNDIELNSIGALARYTLNETQYKEIAEVGAIIDPSLTGIALTAYLTVGLTEAPWRYADDLSNAPNATTYAGNFIRTLNGANYFAFGGTWIDQQFYNDLTLMPYILSPGKNRYTASVVALPYATFIYASNAGSSFQPVQHAAGEVKEIVGHESTHAIFLLMASTTGMDLNHMFDKWQAPAQASMGGVDMPLIYARRDDRITMHFLETGDWAVTSQHGLCCLANSDGKDGWGNAPEKNSLGNYTRYTVNEEQYNRIYDNRISRADTYTFTGLEAHWINRFDPQTNNLIVNLDINQWSNGKPYTIYNESTINTLIAQDVTNGILIDGAATLTLAPGKMATIIQVNKDGGGYNATVIGGNLGGAAAGPTNTQLSDLNGDITWGATFLLSDYIGKPLHIDLDNGTSRTLYITGLNNGDIIHIYNHDYDAAGYTLTLDPKEMGSSPTKTINGMDSLEMPANSWVELISFDNAHFKVIAASDPSLTNNAMTYGKCIARSYGLY